MKKLLIVLYFACLAIIVQAQGLEQILVEKYYVSNAADAAYAAANEINPLPVGSVTYRFYVDMLPGYNVQMAYGNANHPLSFSTTTSFFNNEDNGAEVPSYSAVKAKKGTTMVDSWLTLGSAANGAGFWGVVKTEDTDAPFVNANGILKNADPQAGIAISVQDGLLAGIAGTAGFLGTDATPVFGAGATNNSYVVNGGSWYKLGGVVGPTATNRVLIAQITTDGILTYNLNVILGYGAGLTENYVYSNPVAGELTGAQYKLSGTLGAPPVAPVVSLTAPAAGATYLTGAPVAITATATDADGTVVSVDFQKNGVSIGTDTNGADGWSLTWTSVAGAASLTAVATDNDGNVTTSLPVSVTVNNPVAPTVTISGAPVTVTNGGHIIFTAAKVDGTAPVTNVEFFVNGVSAQAGLGLTYDWTSNSIGNAIPVSVTVTSIYGTATANTTVKVVDGSSNYEIVSKVENCNAGDHFSVTIAKTVNPLLDVTGFDFTVIYDATKVKPTGQIDVLTNAGGAKNTNTAYTTNVVGDRLATDTMYVSLYLDGNSIAADGWDGMGDLFSIGFAKLSPAFIPSTTVSFSVADMKESTVLGVSDAKVVTSGTYTTIIDNTYTGFVKFWSDNQPIFGVGSIATKIQIGLNPIVNTDVDGKFTVNFGDGSNMQMAINKDLDNSASVALLPAVYSGYDAFRTAQVTANVKTFRPSAQQVIAMDVNRDGKISAGDISQINQRTVKAIDQFSTSLDWAFINELALLNDASFVISGNYPLADATGYSKERVPANTSAFNLNSIFANPTTCPVLVDGNNSYYGIAIGDVDGSWAAVAADGIRKSTSSDAVIFDLTNAYRVGDYLDVPVMVRSASTVNSLDLVVEYNNASASFESVSNRTDYINALDKNDGQFYALTSYSLSGYEVEKPIMFVHVYAPKGFEAKDVLNATAYVNGNKSTTVLESSIKVDVSATVRIYPNPVSEILSVEVPQEVTLQLYNALGKTMFIKTNVAGKEEIDVRGLASGFYTMKISNSNFTSFKQIVVTK